MSAARPRLAAAIALLLVAFGAPGVLAHAGVLASEPAAGSAVGGAFPGPVIVEFTEAVEDGSGLALVDATGIEIGSGAFDAAMPTRIVIDLASPLGPGTYEIRWTIRTDDGHVERGTIPFTVTEPMPSATPTPEPSLAPTAAPSAAPATPTPSPTPAASADGSGGSSGAEAFVPIIAVAAIVALGLVLVLRRRAPGR